MKLRHYSFLAASLLLTACESGSVQDTLGLNRTAPDEFTVVSRPPLSVPPEFSLRPPKPGEPARGMDADARARELIIGRSATATTTLEMPTVDTAVTPVIQSDALTNGANSLLKRAGASAADDSIRDKLAVDAVTPVDTSNAKTLMDKISGAEKNEPTVDAAKEAERLRENKDSGKPLNEGDVPEEKPGSDSLIDRIF